MASPNPTSADTSSTTTADPSLSQHRLFTSLESYPWSTDAEFQSGLSAILGPASTPTDGASTTANGASTRTTELTLRARCFYYARKFDTPVDFAAYSSWRAGRHDWELAPLELAVPAPGIESSEPVTPERGAAGSAGITPDREGAADESAANGSPGMRAVDSTGAGQQEPYANGDETQPSSFAEVMQLIQSGKPIPGIKDIPNTILEGQGSQPTKSQRRKPWERDSAPSSETQSTVLPP